MARAVMTSGQVRGLMLRHHKTVKAVASKMKVPEDRVREARARGVAGAAVIRDWVQGITGKDPGRLTTGRELLAAAKNAPRPAARAQKKKRPAARARKKKIGKYSITSAKLDKAMDLLAAEMDKKAPITLKDLRPATGAQLKAARARRRRNSERARKRAAPLVKLGSLPVIGDKVLKIDYEGGQGKDPRSAWTHDFTKARAKVYGLPDGSLLIKGAKRLWRMFK